MISSVKQATKKVIARANNPRIPRQEKTQKDFKAGRVCEIQIVDNNKLFLGKSFSFTTSHINTLKINLLIVTLAKNLQGFNSTVFGGGDVFNH